MQPQPPDPPGGDQPVTDDPPPQRRIPLSAESASWRPQQQPPLSSPWPQPPPPQQQQWPQQGPPQPPPAPQQPPGSRDDTTRYLCAAAHLNPSYADAAIKEFLVEPTRSVPPSPGVNAAAVLAEALAARARTKLRDAALLALAVVFALTTPLPLLVAGVVLSVLVSLPMLSAGGVGPVVRTGQSKTLLVVAGLVAVAVVIFLVFLTSGLAQRNTYSYGQPASTGASGAVKTGLSVLAATAMLTIFISDRLAVWSLLTTRFRRSASGSLTGDLRDIHRFSPRRFIDQLRRYHAAGQDGSAAEPSVPLVVYRGYSPFVGAGVEYEPWSTALPLVRLPDQPADGSAETLTTSVLYDRIRAEMAELVRATPLTPGRRLRELKVFDQVIVSARELVDHFDERDTVTSYFDAYGTPKSSLWMERAKQLEADPQEWARYYLCFQVETWDRDLVVSVYLHVAVDEGTLYLEWTPCLLYPIDRRYQEIDSLPTSRWTPARQALLDLIRLPASIPGRIANLLSSFRPLPREPGTLDPRWYGSLQSLRELAAGRNVHDYFQRADVERYTKILDSRFIAAVSRIMREFGYSSAAFEEQAAAIVTNNVSFNGNYNAPVVVGSRVSGGVSSSGTQRVGGAPGTRS
jgi:hypothetical protein